MDIKVDTFFNMYNTGTTDKSVLTSSHDSFVFDFSNNAEIGDVADLSTHLPKSEKNAHIVSVPEETKMAKDFESVNTATKIKMPDEVLKKVPDTGTTDSDVLKYAPSPAVTIAGKPKTATIVVDLSVNVLYKYNKEGCPEVAYRIATGKKSTPTDKGVRIVTHKETFPYRGAPRNSKRRRTPRAFGPYIICLNVIDPKTGAQSSTGEFIHGTNEPETPKNGMYASHGCMRMNNDIITKLKDEVQRDDIVIIE